MYVYIIDVQVLELDSALQSVLSQLSLKHRKGRVGVSKVLYKKGGGVYYNSRLLYPQVFKL